MSFVFKKCYTSDDMVFEGLYEVYPKLFGDERGYLFENYNQNDFFSAGLKMNFVQENQSLSKKGTLRGLHFQKNHSQGKLVRVLQGQVFDVVVDLRSSSKTFGKYFGIILDSEKRNMLYVPKGFAHGFLTLSEQSVCLYKFSDLYDNTDEGGLLWNDPVIGIDWESVYPGITKIINLSEKDRNHPAFDKNKKYFDITGKWIGLE